MGLRYHQGNSYALSPVRKLQLMAVITELLHTGDFTGKVEWIGTAPASREPLQPRQSVELVTSKGIAGEHHFREAGTSKRQVTLIQHEHLPVVASLLGQERIDPGVLRRNIVVSGINLAALRDQEFCIGGATLKGTGDCVPCALMEANLGPGGYAAMLAHGGITCIIVRGGTVRIGDSVSVDPHKH